MKHQVQNHLESVQPSFPNEHLKVSVALHKHLIQYGLKYNNVQFLLAIEYP